MRDFQVPTRSAAISGEAMAATSHPLATLAAIDVLRGGGNAADAAIAASAVLCVAEPHMTGIGGDCFVLYASKGGTPIALNGSGRAPAAATLDWYLEHGFTEIPERSAHAVTVPGAVDAWFRLNADHGTREMASLLAATLRAVAAKGRAAFYEGPVAEDIVARLRELGGLHTVEDFACQRSAYETPIAVPYGDHEVYECPPNGQGIVALMMLRALAGYDLYGDGTSEADRIHLLAEVTKAAYAVRDAYFCDPATDAIDIARFLSEGHAELTRSRICLDRASPDAAWDEPEHRDTVYLAVVDRDGNAISFINSLFAEFGTGIMAPRSGVLLHSRGSIFRVKRGHPNAIAPRKRPLHTIIPGMLVRAGQAVMPFGVMGGHYQATGHANLISRILAGGMDPQAAADASRSFAYGDGLQLETTVPEVVVSDLARRGHKVVQLLRPLGGAQAIRIDRERGVLVGGSDPRKDGCALGL